MRGIAMRIFLRGRRTGPSLTMMLSMALGLGLAASFTACTTPSPPPRVERAAAPPLRSPSTAAVARKVNVVDHRGETLDQGEREQMLRKVAAQGNATLVQRQMAAMSGFGELDLYSGNDARLLIDGPQTFAAMFAAIRRARQQILLESYIIEDAEVSRQLAELLAQKRAQGVAVHLIYDAVGSFGTQESYFDGLRQAGVAICAFNPVNPLKRPGYFDITNRDHRKILVVDNEIGFTGGINISAVYSSGSSLGRKRKASDEEIARDGWRDTQLQLRGPAVTALGELVRETWQQQGCEGRIAALPQPAKGTPAGQQLMRIVPAAPSDASNRIYAMLLTAIGAAQRSVYLTMAYFAPGNEMIDALCAAAHRGVDVQLVLPSRSDFTPVLHAGRSHYERLLEAGVKIHELQDAVLHAKTAVIDGVVSTVGSSNLDWRSFTSNTEVNAVVIGDDFGQAMTQMFRRDLAASQTISGEAWRERPAWQRFKESLARAFERWW
ncbi:cardiolipin synthase [Roseateles violae]|uniref:Cardiolipin synthase n=1 Tax=Roseateles violae TaxID=3058042 RepID=A0ABT8DUE5_9BURK|nr:cardiolipin synthase [Pelomonas sp. PFR6]MDN3920655.1 cardiolipin synthase [Pelomonas sp. PFR6]